jgi:hypothetical protein
LYPEQTAARRTDSSRSETISRWRGAAGCGSFLGVSNPSASRPPDEPATEASGVTGRAPDFGLRRLTNRWPLSVALVVTATAFVGMLVVFTPSFHTNDDVVMSMFASGTGLAEAPDEHLIFTNVLIGLALKAFYERMPDRPWYGWYLYVAYFLAQLGFVYAILAQGFSWPRLGACLLWLVTAGLTMLNTLHFTTTAFLVTQGGALLVLLCVRRRLADPAARITGAAAFGVALIVLGSLIRLDGCYLALVLAVPAWATMVVPSAAGRRAILVPALALPVVALAFIQALAAYNRHYYEHEPGWQGFYARNAIRNELMDSGRARWSPMTRPVFDAVGWSENDQRMLMTWYLADDGVFGLPTLRRIVEGVPARYRQVSVDDLALGLSPVLRDRSVILLAAILPLCLLLMAWRGAEWVALGATLAVISGVMLCLLVFLRAPPAPVYYPMLAYPVALLAFLARGPGDPEPGVRRLRLQAGLEPGGSWSGTLRIDFSRVLVGALALALLATAAGAYRQYRRSGIVQHHNGVLKAAIADLAPRENQLYVAWGAFFPYEAILPGDRPRVLAGLRLLSLGWPQNTPIDLAMKRRFGIGELSRALYRRTDLYVISDRVVNLLFRCYAWERHRATVGFELYRQYESFRVFRVVEQPGERAEHCEGE